MMVWSLFIIDLMGLFFYNKNGSIISIGDLPTTNIIEPKIPCLMWHGILLYSLLRLIVFFGSCQSQSTIWIETIK